MILQFSSNCLKFALGARPVAAFPKKGVARAYLSALSPVSMSRRPTRSIDWGFPRWRAYGADTQAAKVRLCDRHGCDQPGNCPAPKSPNNPERWWFCQEHAGEYNRGWNYFEGLSAEEAAERESNERRDSAGFREAQHYGWAGAGDGSRSRDELRALEELELETDADFDTIKIAWRRLAKSYHPDVKPGDEAAAGKFKRVQAAYDVLRAAEERRLAL